MGEIADLAGADAVAEVKRIAESEVAMFCTSRGEGELETRPMSTQVVDEDGTLWFFSGVDSNKNRAIQSGCAVRLIYAVPSKSAYMTLEGEASIVRDRKKIEELWNPIVKAWFSEGKDDPRLSLLAFRPTRGHYWDTKTNRAVQLVKITVGAITGKPFDDGVQGRILP